MRMLRFPIVEGLDGIVEKWREKDVEGRDAQHAAYTAALVSSSADW